jgi:hypothetical protein
MSVLYRSLSSVLVMCGLAVGIAHARDNGPIVVVRSPEGIVLDGRLDEPAWQRASVMKLVQQSPEPGEPTPYETEVRVILEGDRLYFGFLLPGPRAAKNSGPQHDAR